MIRLFRIFIDLCLLRARPDDLPASPALLGLTLAAYTLTSVALTTASLSFGSALLYGAVDTLILAVLTHLMLMLRRFPARLIQTLTALAGSGAVLGLLALPLGDVSGPSLLVLAFLVWSLAVSANILRHALSVPLTMGILVSLAYLIITFIVVSSLFPALVQAPATA